jgi:hypothetical protein
MKIPPWILLCCLCSVGPIYAIQPDFGPNLTIFDPSMSAGTIQSEVDAVSQVQALPSSHFNTARHAFLFKPGTYNVDVEVGYYTSVAGLGLSPDDVTINGLVHVEGTGGQGEPGGQNGVFGDCALVNFWRSAENMHIIPQSGQTERWAVSQASPFRRMHASGGTQPSGTPLFWIMPLYGGFSSGGFIADSLHHTAAEPGDPGEAVPVRRLGRQFQCLRPGVAKELLRNYLGKRTSGRFIDPDHRLLHRPAD